MTLCLRSPGEPSAKKRKMREPKFSEEETTFIFQQTEKKQRLLVERHGPATTEDKKNKFWERLAQDVTSINGHKHIRTATQVKKKWRNTCSAAKNKVRTNANERRKTGGGTAEVKPLTAQEEVFLQHMPVRRTATERPWNPRLQGHQHEDPEQIICRGSYPA